MTISPRNHTPDTPGASADDWRHHALCKGHPDPFDTDQFEANRPDNPHLKVARLVCDSCPVKISCLRTAMRDEAGESERGRWGIYAGWTPRERRRASLFPAAVQRWIEYPGRPRHQLWANEPRSGRGAA